MNVANLDPLNFMPLKRVHRILGTTLSAAIPVVYMVATHISWEKSPREKLRMALKHLGFWGGMAGTIYAAHRYAPKAKTTGRAFAIFAVAGLLPILGYEIMRRVTKAFIPRETQPAPTPALDADTLRSLLAPPQVPSSKPDPAPVHEATISTTAYTPTQTATYYSGYPYYSQNTAYGGYNPYGTYAWSGYASPYGASMWGR